MYKNIRDWLWRDYIDEKNSEELILYLLRCLKKFETLEEKKKPTEKQVDIVFRAAIRNAVVEDLKEISLEHADKAKISKVIDDLAKNEWAFNSERFLKKIRKLFDLD